MQKKSWTVNSDATVVVYEAAKSAVKDVKVVVILIVLSHATESVMLFVPITAIKVVLGETRLTETSLIA